MLLLLEALCMLKSTRPDIAFAVGMLGRYQSNPGLDHWRAAKKVMRYLQWTKDYMLMYRRTKNLEVVGYSDSDFVGCVDSRKSTSGYIFNCQWSCIMEECKTDFDCYFHYGS
ncbi:UNVERIFIED_CONTAM: Secreted RxLR effector protein [Sesamum latifolium]|uniref:Secreted RxLR effector protein n=1 Tax=Sesamum latifolium TaxID=2727402 RepID=A0AAW2VFU2_9LAMI